MSHCGKRPRLVRREVIRAIEPFFQEHDVKVDVRLKIIKPLHARRWIIFMYEHLKETKDLFYQILERRTLLTLFLQSPIQSICAKIRFRKQKYIIFVSLVYFSSKISRKGLSFTFPFSVFSKKLRAWVKVLELETLSIDFIGTLFSSISLFTKIVNLSQEFSTSFSNVFFAVVEAYFIFKLCENDPAARLHFF